MGSRHELRGPCARGRVCPEACGDRGGEARRVQGGGRPPVPASKPWQRHRALSSGAGGGHGKVVGVGGCAGQFWPLGPGARWGQAGAAQGAEYGGGGAGGADGAEVRQCSRGAPHSSPRRPWSCGACGRSRRAWWLVCGVSAAWCVAGSPGTSAASRDSWTCTVCAWWAWGLRPWACRSFWTGATSPEVPANPRLLPLPPPTPEPPAQPLPVPHTLRAFGIPPRPAPSLSRSALLLFQFSCSSNCGSHLHPLALTSFPVDGQCGTSQW